MKTAARQRIKREELHQQTVLQNEEKNVDDPFTSEALKWLELNNSPWDIVLQKWVQSSASRVKQLKQLQSEEILKKYRLYAEKFGFQLVSKIFDLIFVLEITSCISPSFFNGFV